MHASTRTLDLPLAVAMWSASWAVALADDPVAWNFSVGDELRYRITQSMDQEIELPPAADAPQVRAVLASKATFEVSWRVVAVGEDGTAELRYTFRRVALRLETPGLGVDIDSSTVADATGPAAMLSPLVRAMIDNEITAQVTPQGDIVGWDVPDRLVRALRNSPGSKAVGNISSPAGLKMLARQILFAVPAVSPLEPGYSWSVSHEVAGVTMGAPQAQSHSIVTTYRYEGRRDEAGASLAIFTPDIAVDFANQNDVISQSTRGEIRFDAVEGRLQSASVDHAFALDYQRGQRTGHLQVKQTSDVALLDESVESADDALN